MPNRVFVVSVRNLWYHLFSCVIVTSVVKAMSRYYSPKQHSPELPSLCLDSLPTRWRCFH
ncbi:hypothetical protein EJ08DRAFT_352828 [Tothia fuscella]|uniref:Uncharacterized protein n=1 Tax=Tothia fuscella TaxID=1048955 RepID=A0A9P4TW40_9PEZI|nr:hypothetical protein EJ08DRAFT_352828 [Tothia fuscella]